MSLVRFLDASRFDFHAKESYVPLQAIIVSVEMSLELRSAFTFPLFWRPLDAQPISLFSQSNFPSSGVDLSIGGARQAYYHDPSKFGSLWHTNEFTSFSKGKFPIKPTGYFSWRHSTIEFLNFDFFSLAFTVILYLVLLRNDKSLSLSLSLWLLLFLCYFFYVVVLLILLLCCNHIPTLFPLSDMYVCLRECAAALCCLTIVNLVVVDHY